MSSETQAPKLKQDDDTSCTDTESAIISTPHTPKTESLNAESSAPSVSSEFPDSDGFIPDNELRKKKMHF